MRRSRFCEILKKETRRGGRKRGGTVARVTGTHLNRATGDPQHSKLAKPSTQLANNGDVAVVELQHQQVGHFLHTDIQLDILK